MISKPPRVLSGNEIPEKPRLIPILGTTSDFYPEVVEQQLDGIDEADHCSFVVQNVGKFVAVDAEDWAFVARKKSPKTTASDGRGRGSGSFQGLTVHPCLCRENKPEEEPWPTSTDCAAAWRISGGAGSLVRHFGTLPSLFSGWPSSLVLPDLSWLIAPRIGDGRRISLPPLLSGLQPAALSPICHGPQLLPSVTSWRETRWRVSGIQEARKNRGSRAAKGFGNSVPIPNNLDLSFCRSLWTCFSFNFSIDLFSFWLDPISMKILLYVHMTR
ncbi:hypothetical protein ABZP36_028734 [Zizania latifolia]